MTISCRHGPRGQLGPSCHRMVCSLMLCFSCSCVAQLRRLVRNFVWSGRLRWFQCHQSQGSLVDNYSVRHCLTSPMPCFHKTCASVQPATLPHIQCQIFSQEHCHIEILPTIFSYCSCKKACHICAQPARTTM